MDSFEGIPNRERTIEDISSEVQDYIEAKGWFFNLIPDANIQNGFRFQIWTHQGGLPLLEREGLDAEIETLQERYASVPGLKVEKLHFAGGATNILIALDKQSEIG